MHTDSSSYVSYFAPIHHHLPPSEHQTSLQRSVGSARMTGSPYPTTAQLHSNPVSGLNHEQFSPPVQPISSYRTPSHYSPLRQTSLGYSPYSSEIAAASAESPLSSSSANESPLPEPPIDNMDNDIAAHVATGNDDHYPYAVSDDIAVGYPYGHIGARPFPLPSYVLEHPELYKQPVSAPLPLNISAAMGYSWSPEAKKFQPLYPPIQQTQRQEHSPKYTSQPAVVSSIHFSTRSSSASAQSFGNDIAEADLVYPQPLPRSRHYTNAPTQMAQHQLPSGYPNLRQSTSAKHKNGLSFPDVYNQSADIASSTNGLGTFDALLESGSPTFSATQVSGVANHSSLIASPPTMSSSTLDLALYAQSPTNPASMNVPVLSAPVPRRSAYFGTSLVDNCERTCQEQEQQQERQGLRVRTQGLQEQLTVRPAEVSPTMGFAELPEGGEEDADGEPDVEPFSLHNGHSISGNSTNRARHTREEGMYNYAGIGGSLPGTISGEDVDGLDERNGHDLDYRPDEDDDDGDGDFEPHSRTTSKNTRSLRPRSIAGRNPVRYNPYGADVPPSAVKHSPRSPLISADDMSPTSSSGQAGKTRKNSRTLPIPVPVPNLTKKSRGRRVPTVTGTSVVRGQRDAALGARIYLCDVIGCGKCFARGEHLKRHIRSIHTYEKPHKCPYPGCGKEFSRHDNLGQHMKVHKDFPKVMERMRGEEV